jgi:hypothetical protein
MWARNTKRKYLYARSISLEGIDDGHVDLERGEKWADEAKMILIVALSGGSLGR